MVLSSKDITSWFKILEIINPDTPPETTPENMTAPYSKYDITNLLKGANPIASLIALSKDDWISFAI